MLIKARLNGHEFDLLTLAELFHEGEPTVAADTDGYYLSFTVPDGLVRDGGGLHDAAAVLLYRVNGVAWALGSDFRPVYLTGRFDDETGHQHAVVRPDTIEVRTRIGPVTVLAGGRKPLVPPAPGPGYVQLALAHSDVAEVLDIFGKAGPAPGWVELFKGFEIVNDDVEGCVKRGWLSRNQVSVFKASANRREVSGELARHARYKGDAPANTMTLPEARQLIRGLVTRWLAWLCSSPPGS